MTSLIAMKLGTDPVDRRALELAWESCAAGTVGVGALLVDGDGAVLAEGNNSIFASGGVGPLTNSRIAHAEMNVMAQIGPGVVVEDATLVTSLEPCPMCAGALILHNVGRVRVLASDPLMHGLDSMGASNEWIRARWKPREMSDDPVARRLALLFAGHVFFFWFDTTSDFVAAVTADQPEIAEWITEVVERRIVVDLAGAGATFEEVLGTLEL